MNACWIYDVDLYIGINMLVGTTDIDPKKTIEFESKSIKLNDNMLTYNSNQNKATCQPTHSNTTNTLRVLVI